MGDLTLSDVDVNTTVKVVNIKPGSKVKRRLMDMGIIRGTKIKVEGKAPLGDPISIIIRGYHLTLRSNEAKDILVKGEV
ncbi:ferrous iron transport protein A [Clostridium acetireducens DSM 10703]|uniref:Ferrous iron transport protein A n=1 Tax=Clostridium acetireducens DSM 10703 TaxID=1121290 RepID=A0A1E8F0F4_9CLOT|nr:ferrous iron transport protein A [Clostridium acetireducens]OFI06783.1 ferrous iron transport protein A [Clostridium acetireducens DSM 10703]